jgi:hypothetical protein
MEIHQIVIRPHANSVIGLYDDGIGNRNSFVFDSTGNAAVAAVVALCKQKLPSDAENPAKAEIQREIASLESRLGQLKTAIGVP